jgi:hypothetical protein
LVSILRNLAKIKSGHHSPVVWIPYETVFFFLGGTLARAHGDRCRRLQWEEVFMLTRSNLASVAIRQPISCRWRLYFVIAFAVTIQARAQTPETQSGQPLPTTGTTKSRLGPLAFGRPHR